MRQIIFLMVSVVCLPSCAVYYRDAKTGAEHIWGIGHLASKVTAPEDSKQAVITRKTLTGFSIGIEDSNFGFSAGWDQRERTIIYDENAVISIIRPENQDVFLFKFGTKLPTDFQELEKLEGKNHESQP